MDSIDIFHRLVGETMMFCQCIEHEVKLIYAAMLKGDINKNFNSIEKQPLGPVLKKLEQLDNSDGKPFFEVRDYKLLDEIRSIRNFWAHEAYIEFLYQSTRSAFDQQYNKIFRRLENDHNRLETLRDITDDIRKEVFEKYGRS